MKLKNGNEIELYFNQKDDTYEGTDKWIKMNHYSVVEIEDEDGMQFIKNVLFRSESKNECIHEMKRLLNNNTIKRSYLYDKYKNM